MVQTLAHGRTPPTKLSGSSTYSRNVLRLPIPVFPAGMGLLIRRRALKQPACQGFVQLKKASAATSEPCIGSDFTVIARRRIPVRFQVLTTIAELIFSCSWFDTFFLMLFSAFSFLVNRMNNLSMRLISLGNSHLVHDLLQRSTIYF